MWGRPLERVADGGEGGEEVHVFEHDVVAMGNQLAPVFAGGLIDGRGDEAEVAAGVVGADVEEAVAVVGVVLDVVAAGLDQRPCCGGLGCGQEVGLAGGVAADFEQDEFLVAGLAGAEVEALVGLFEDERVCRLRLAEGVAIELVLALGLFVFDGVEERGVVVGPDDGADALGGVGQRLAGAEVLDVQGVLAEAGVIDGVGEQVLVLGDGEGAERHEGMAFRRARCRRG